MDYVRNPDPPRNLDAELAERDELVRQVSLKPPADLVAMLLKDADQFGIPCRAIRAAGPRCVPALLAAVNDPRYRGGNQKGMFGFQREPLEGVLICLAEFAPSDAVPVVSRLLTDESDDIRCRVAFLLGSIATDDAANPVAQLLADGDEHVRSLAMNGICRAIDAGRASESFRRIAFDGVQPFVFRRTGAQANKAPRCLLMLDRDRAISVLTNRERLVAGQENSHYVLQALREANVTVDEEILLEIISKLEGVSSEYPNDSVVSKSLLMLATLNSKRGAKAIDRALTHPSPRVREAAAKATGLMSGVDNPLGFARKRLDAVGWEGLSETQRHVLAVRTLIDEVRNGGFLQYFVNSSGNYWRDAVDGLAAIGANRFD